jgi:hypothetical protein
VARNFYSDDPEDLETQNDFDTQHDLDTRRDFGRQDYDESTLTPDEIRQLKRYVAREMGAEARSRQLEYQDLFRWLWRQIHQLFKARANALNQEHLHEIINSIMEDFFGGKWA